MDRNPVQPKRRPGRRGKSPLLRGHCSDAPCPPRVHGSRPVRKPTLCSAVPVLSAPVPDTRRQTAVHRAGKPVQASLHPQESGMIQMLPCPSGPGSSRVRGGPGSRPPAPLVCGRPARHPDGNASGTMIPTFGDGRRPPRSVVDSRPTRTGPAPRRAGPSSRPPGTGKHRRTRRANSRTSPPRVYPDPAAPV